MRKRDRIIAVSAWAALAAAPALAVLAARGHTEGVRSALREQAERHGDETVERNARERELEAEIRKLLLAEQEVRSLRATAAAQHEELNDLRAHNEALRREAARADAAGTGRVTRAWAEMIERIETLERDSENRARAEAEARSEANRAAVAAATAEREARRIRTESREANREVNRLRNRVASLQDLTGIEETWTRNFATTALAGGFWTGAAMIGVATWRREIRQRTDARRREGAAQRHGAENRRLRAEMKDAGRRWEHATATIREELRRVTEERDDLERTATGMRERLAERNAERQRLRASIHRLEADLRRARETAPGVRQTAGLMILGIEVGATRESAKGAYRKLARTLHPDVCPGPEANRLMTLATACYEELPKTP